MNRYENKVAIVTGAASGMGKAAAIRLAQEGASVLLCDINEQGLQATMEDIDSAGGTAQVQTFNAMEEDSCAALVPAAIDHFGKLNVVVCAAGISKFYELETINSELFNRTMTINCVAPVIICKHAMPHLIETGGNVINFTSINSRYPCAYHSVYCASKAALMSFTKSMALEFADKGVRVNCISPGSIDTPMNDDVGITDKMDFNKIKRLMALAQPNGSAEEVASLVAYLGSDEARFINGDDLTVDGATTCTM